MKNKISALFMGALAAAFVVVFVGFALAPSEIKASSAPIEGTTAVTEQAAMDAPVPVAAASFAITIEKGNGYASKSDAINERGTEANLISSIKIDTSPQRTAVLASVIQTTQAISSDAHAAPAVLPVPKATVAVS